MPRTPNHVPTVNITLSTTPQVQAYLKDLASEGLHGKTAAEAAERLITRVIAQMIKDGEMRRRGKRP